MLRVGKGVGNKEPRRRVAACGLRRKCRERSGSCEDCGYHGHGRVQLLKKRYAMKRMLHVDWTWNAPLYQSSTNAGNLVCQFTDLQPVVVGSIDLQLRQIGGYVHEPSDQSHDRSHLFDVMRRVVRSLEEA